MKTQNLLTLACAAALGSMPLALAAQSSADQSIESKDVEAAAVDEEALDQDLTAKDFLGREVVDAEGEKIGDIADIGLGSSFAIADQTQSRAHSAIKHDSETDSSSQTTKDQKKHEYGLSKMTEIGQSLNPEPVVYISVGGVMGVGDKHVRVPASALQWKADDECFQLNVSKESIVALTEDPATAYNAR